MASASSVSHSACLRRTSVAPASSSRSAAKRRTVSSIVKRPSRRRSRLLSTSMAEAFERHVAHALGGLQRAAAGEDPEAGEGESLVGAEQVVAPLDRGYERLLAGGGIARSGTGGRCGSRSSRSRISAGASSLARAAASSIASGSPSSRCRRVRPPGRWTRRARSRDRPPVRDCEEPQRVGLDERLERKVGVGGVERRHRISRSTVNRSGARLVARIRCAGPRRAGRRRRAPRRGSARSCRGRENRRSRRCSVTLSASGRPAFPHLERLRDRGYEQLRIRDRREADEQGAVAELGLERMGDGEPQPGLARPSRARERDETRALVAEERADRRVLEPAADERRRGHGQRPRRARGASGAARLGSCPRIARSSSCKAGLGSSPRSSAAATWASR